MSTISFDQAIVRVQENDSRFAMFVNGAPTDVYITSDNKEVKSIQNFLHEKSIDIDTLVTNTISSIITDNSSQTPINFIGDFPANPPVGTYLKNSVYKNTTDGSTYILSGTPLSWGLYLEAGVNWEVIVESSAGTIFRVGQDAYTMLIAHVFRNGLEVTNSIQAHRFGWRRVSYIPRASPNDDETWNSSYSVGYKQIQIRVDEVKAHATYHCDIFDT